MDAIVQDALALIGERIYGGFVYMAGGALRFNGCFFWDFEVRRCRRRRRQKEREERRGEGEAGR